MKRKGNLARAEMNVARRMWGSLGSEKMLELQSLVERRYRRSESGSAS